MRIRKRQVPLPFSSLSPLSDPLRRPVQLLRPTSALPPPPPSDSPSLEQQQQHDIITHHHDHTTRDIKVFGAQTSNGLLPQSTSNSPQVMGEWCEREKAFPLKKRRGSFKRPSENEEDEDQITTTVKTLMINNKCSLPQKQEQQEHQSKPPGLNLPGKKKSRGGALMEGSRCSRVNGRGWRCCQQTLVGYSLCEHHLGKGRLRSMNSVRSRSLAAATAPKSVAVVEKEDEKKPSPSPPSPLALTSKKRMKLGVVKARSISSLLGQPDCAMATPPPQPLPPTPQDDNTD